MAQPVPVLLWAWCALTALAGAAQGSFEVSVSPEAAVVEHGGSVWINCSTTCRDPGASGGLETSLTKTDRKSGSSWVAFRLVNIKEWVSSPQCFFNCDGSTTLVTANIFAYRAPERVVLEPLPEMELGQAYNVTCRVLNVAPVTRLTVTLRRGGQTLHTETFQNHTGTGPDDITVITEITPQRSDHGQEITCHAALDLHGSHFENSSSAVELKVYDLPEEPQLRTSLYIEVGTRATARCRVAGVFPVAGEAWFNLSFGGESLNFTVTTSGDTATAQGEVWSPSPGQYQLNCTVSVGPVSRSAGQSVLVYRLPEPVLEVTESRTLVNSSVTVTCRSPEADPPGVLLQLRDAERLLVSSAPAQPLAQLHLTAGEEDNGREFTCEARPDSGIPAVKRTSARLTVLYGPRMDDSGCPREWIWKEGTEQTFSCLAQGNPAPAVVCTKGGVSASIGVQRQVRREDAGTYHCKASNAHGSASRDVTVQVEYLPEEPWLQTSRYIEVGARPLARCGVAGVFPVAGEARFTLSFGGESLNFTVTTLDNTATAQGEVWSPSPGQHQLNCTVTVGPVSRSAGQSVLVYRFPEPVLEVTESRTLVNSSVTVMCRSPEADPPGVLLQLRDAERLLVSSAPAQPLAQLQLTAGEEDNGREFTCEATPVSGIPAVKRTSARLTVLYGPRMDDSGCPREWIWKEETEQTFSCLARGNPAPAVVCTKDGVPVSIGVQRQVRREDAGTYHCKASNAHGSASRDVTVQVEYLNILGLALGLVGALAALTGLGVGGYMYYRSTRIRNYRLRQQQAKQAEQGKPAEQMSLNGATQNTPDLEHSV
ncbi:intercellular adhesion molecule 5-like [Malaclemys terrapin pileata]|uniref:intercellular adhesion molecule 5-like n=1 Tax=Malaclemys terrapin pileata TaxID=2991368 RepID=UPI0023A86C36|nr:intercellular adhesion molecule 5-like [Malaclemys terrapin pileata]